MLIVYFVDFGVTQIIVPRPLRPYLGELLDLGIQSNIPRHSARRLQSFSGWGYYAYMAGIAIFCPNSINILAGINGVEVTQSIVIAVFIMINDLIYLLPLTSEPHPATDSHLSSFYLLMPFTGVSLALWYHNWYPAKVFVGDTYCYFAGMVFAVDAILGHFGKTLLLLLIPQAINFVYSAPQLFHIVPCPRHRLPRFNARTGLLEPSTVEFQKPLPKLVARSLKLMHDARLINIKEDSEGRVTESTNMTLLNLCLVWFGPMREDRLTIRITALQVFCAIFGLFFRHRLALWLFTQDNL
jgi:UDP-N-acetylglucosamine--dolichyl-phosphate N-acetylglucosaminephosphotransferase